VVDHPSIPKFELKIETERCNTETQHPTFCNTNIGHLNASSTQGPKSRSAAICFFSHNLSSLDTISQFEHHEHPITCPPKIPSAHQRQSNPTKPISHLDPNFSCGYRTTYTPATLATRNYSKTKRTQLSGEVCHPARSVPYIPSGPDCVSTREVLQRSMLFLQMYMMAFRDSSFGGKGI
jgi:hypothetical protein